MNGKVKSIIKRNIPNICFGAGMFMVGKGAYDAYISGQKANEVLLEYRKAKGEAISKAEELKVTAKNWIPPVLETCTGLVLMYTARKMDIKNNALLLAAYEIAKTRNDDISEAITELMSPEQQNDIKDCVAKKQIARADENNTPKPPIIIGNDGTKVLMYEPWSGRYFYGSINTIDKTMNKMTSQLFYQDSVSMNEIFLEMGLDAIKLGNEFGYTTRKHRAIEAYYTTCMSDDDRPCVVVNITPEPVMDFDKI